NVLGADNVEIVDPTMGGEDFSEYSLPDHSIPAVDFHIGAVDPEKIGQCKKEGKELPSLHSSKFAPVPEPTIRVGIIGMTSAVLDVMKYTFASIAQRSGSANPRDPSTPLGFARDDIA